MFVVDSSAQNAADIFLAFKVGQLSEVHKDPKMTFVIISRDKFTGPLQASLLQSGRKCIVLTSVVEIEESDLC
jgi:hypothetical protein